MDLTKFKECINKIDTDDLLILQKTLVLYNNIIILGNGGSNAISCHLAEDYTKTLNIKTLCFGDSARMSCYANDYGWDNAYTMFLKQFVTHNTLVILISSSGNSENILRAAKYCFENKIKMITLSGFSEKNLLRHQYASRSLLHFWIDSSDYGIVECCHEIILHSVL